MVGARYSRSTAVFQSSAPSQIEAARSRWALDSNSGFLRGDRNGNLSKVLLRLASVTSSWSERLTKEDKIRNRTSKKREVLMSVIQSLV